MSTMIKIRSGRKMPENRKGRTQKYPWKSMKIGQSFDVPKGLARSSAAQAAQWAQKTYGKKFSVRAINDGFACWRTK